MSAARRLIGAGVVVAALAAIAGGLWLVGSPGAARRMRLDERRVTDLQSIATNVDVYWARQRVLPETLEVMWATSAGRPTPVDPVSAQPYEYRVLGANEYELCATFDAESQPGRHDDSPPFGADVRPDRYGDSPAFWRHGAGRQCYPLTPKPLREGDRQRRP
jgi:hypothetical protein